MDGIAVWFCFVLFGLLGLVWFEGLERGGNLWVGGGGTWLKKEGMDVLINHISG